MRLIKLVVGSRALRIGLVLLLLAIVYTRRGCYSEPSTVQTETITE